MVHQRRSARPEFGIIGFGRFGRFAARHLGRNGSVLVDDALSTRDPAAYFSSFAGFPPSVRPAAPAEVCAARVLLYAVPIGSLPQVMQSSAPHIRPHTLVADTSSVKTLPCRWLTTLLPPEIEVLGTHPLFGPDSAADGLAGHRIALVPLRLRHPRAVRRFLESLGLRVIETTAEEHDREMAETQSLVHWLGRALARSGAHPRDLDTEGYRRLCEILGHVTGDTWELFRDLQRFNPYAAPARARFLEVLRELDAMVNPEENPR
jgi:prephenate dehydrogenase